MNWMRPIIEAPLLLKIIAIILIVWLVMGCATVPPAPDLDPTVVEVTRYVTYECGVVPALTSITLLEIHWVLFKVGDNAVWTLTAQQYQNLGKNTSMILAGVKELKGQRDFWKTCIDASVERTQLEPPDETS